MGSETSHQNNIYKLRKSVAKFSSRLPDILTEHHQATEELHKQYFRWLDKRNVVIAELSALATEFDFYHDNVNATRVKGSSANIVGNVACVAGLALVPFTAGFSVALSVGGVISSTFGNLTAVTAQTLEYAFEKKALDKALHLVEEDCQETLHLSCLIGLCLKKKTEIEVLLRRINWEVLIRENESILNDVLKDIYVKAQVTRIKNRLETAEDCFVIVALLFNDFSLLSKIYSKQSDLEVRMVSGTLSLAKSITALVSSIKQCAAILNNWRTGLNTLPVASRFFTNRALLGLNLLFDLYNIGEAANEMERGIQSEGALTLRMLTREMENQKKEVLYYCNFLNAEPHSK